MLSAKFGTFSLKDENDIPSKIVVLYPQISFSSSSFSSSPLSLKPKPWMDSKRRDTVKRTLIFQRGELILSFKKKLGPTFVGAGRFGQKALDYNILKN